MSVKDKTDQTYRKLRIFLASPSDLAKEREELYQVVEQLNNPGGIAEHLELTLQVLDWNRHVGAQAGSRPEEIILNDLPVEIWDVFIGILWLRFGTPTGGIRPGTELTYESGTEEEFRLAFDLNQKCGRPKLFFYRCNRPPEDLDTFDLEQYARVKKFFSEFGANLSHPGLPQKFKADFGHRVRSDLERLMVQFKEKVLKNKEPVPDGVLETSGLRSPETLPRREPFFGRRQEIDKALELLDLARREWGIVIDGIGGIGKTSLAVEIAHICKRKGLFNTFIFITAKRDQLKPDRIREHDHSLKTAKEFFNETAYALGHGNIAHLPTLREKMPALKNALAGRNALLIFDNLETVPRVECEKIIDFVSDLPDDCKAILTSRWQAHESGVPIRLDRLKWDEARELIENTVTQYAEELAELRRAGEPGWRKLYETAGGSPLVILHGIGLMRMRNFTFKKTLEVIRDGDKESNLNKFLFSFTINELDEDEKLTLGALSLFAGPASLDALKETTELGGIALSETILQRLGGFSLVNRIEKQDAADFVEDYFGQHPLTKRLAHTLMLENPEVAKTLQERFIDYWHKFALNCNASDEDSYEAFEKLEAEWPNVEAAARLLMELMEKNESPAMHKGMGRKLIEFTRALKEFLKFSKRFDEGILLSSTAYAEACTLREWAKAGWCALDVAYINYSMIGFMDDPSDSSYVGRLDEAREWAKKAGQVWAKLGGKEEQIALSSLKAVLAQKGKHYSQAKGFFERALRIELELGLDVSAASTLNQLSRLAGERKKLKEAKQYLKQALAIAKEHDDKEGQAFYTNNLGELASEGKKWDEAIEYFQQAADVSQKVGLEEVMGGSQYGLAQALQQKGETAAALSSAIKALEIYERLQHSDLENVRDFVTKLQKAGSDKNIS